MAQMITPVAPSESAPPPPPPESEGPATPAKQPRGDRPAGSRWRPAAKRLRRYTGLGIQSKFLIMLLVTSILATSIVGGLGYEFGTRAIERKVFDQLTGLRSARASRLEQYFTNLDSQVLTYSEDPTTVAAMREFSDAFRQLGGATVTPEQDQAVSEYYRNSFLPKLQQNVEGKPSVEGYLPVSPAQRYLQFHYTTKTDDFAAKIKVDDAGDGSTWSAVHRKYQPFFRGIVQRFAFADFMLIDSGTGDVVYATYKGHDLGTNLETGVYADSVLGRAFREARRSGDPQFTYTADYERYRSSSNRPAGFILSPVYDGSRQLGVLALQLPTAAIDNRVTGNRQWEADGLGKTGECFLVGPDYLMRSNARTLLENPELYRSQIIDDGLPPAQADRIVRLKSTILEQPVRSEDIARGLRGESGTLRVTGFGGQPVLSSYAPLQVRGLNWVITCNQDVAEAFAPANDFARRLGIATVGLIVLVTVIALLLAQVFARPIHRLTTAARAVAGGDLNAHVPVTTRDELGELGDSFNDMTRGLRVQDGLIREREAENDRLLANIMPGAIAQRFKQGEQDIVGQHQNVTVLYADVRGFLDYTRQLPPDEAALLLNRLIGAFDEAAERHGVEKFKTVGTSYLAVCGLSVPRVDNDKRVADFALEMQRIVGRYNREHGTALELLVGIDSGGVTAGIVGRRQFVYDMWGDTVSIAARVLNIGTGSAILMTRAVADHLQGIYEFEPVGEIETRREGTQEVLAIKTSEER